MLRNQTVRASWTHLEVDLEEQPLPLGACPGGPHSGHWLLRLARRLALGLRLILVRRGISASGLSAGRPAGCCSPGCGSPGRGSPGRCSPGCCSPGRCSPGAPGRCSPGGPPGRGSPGCGSPGGSPGWGSASRAGACSVSGGLLDARLFGEVLFDQLGLGFRCQFRGVADLLQSIFLLARLQTRLQRTEDLDLASVIKSLCSDPYFVLKHAS